MENLRPVMSKYIKVSKELIELNKEISDLRDERRTVELDLAALYAHNDMPTKIELRESQMVFSVKKPGQWKKGWSLSKKDLEGYLNDILPGNGKDVMREIIQRHEPKLVADDFGFTISPSVVE
jgi:hypothetical protein